MYTAVPASNASILNFLLFPAFNFVFEDLFDVKARTIESGPLRLPRWSKERVRGGECPRSIGTGAGRVAFKTSGGGEKKAMPDLVGRSSRVTFNLNSVQFDVKPCIHKTQTSPSTGLFWSN